MNSQQPIQLHQPDWQAELGKAFTNAADLFNFLNISQDHTFFSQQASRDFTMRVPVSYAECMEKSNPDDPLLRQVLPIADELTNFPGFFNDPVGDIAAAKSAGIIHKYHGRVLLITTGGCAINCRYCFRRNFPYSDFQMSKTRQAEVIQYIRKHSDISEVILSGGDPLLLNDDRLGVLLDKLSKITHIKRIRIHSRIPIVLPSRINQQLLDAFTRIPQQIILVLHCNHANEISPRVIAACLKLKQGHIHLFNQSVLLKGINDNAKQLCQLSEKLFASGIVPYYLHLLDKATGTGHFEVEEHTALTIMQDVKATLPGYLVPKLVREEPGAASKTELTF
jgi:EF-P beta-lysylation protein EpmB